MCVCVSCVQLNTLIFYINVYIYNVYYTISIDIVYIKYL